jgi:hypothetical protein
MTMNHHFVVCLLPGFLQFAFYYWFVADRSSVPYAQQSVRQKLDTGAAVAAAIAATATAVFDGPSWCSVQEINLPQSAPGRPLSRS